MHFWIDKRSQGCGFSGRHLVPPSLCGYGRNQRHLRCGLHLKPMVTPVHRFQSIESVANNSLRHARSSGYHSRVPPHYQTYTNNVPSNGRNVQLAHSLEMITTTTSNNNNTPSTLRRTGTSTAKLKCGFWIFFALIAFFLAGAKYYFYGVDAGLEGFIFCTVLVVTSIIGGLVSLYEEMKRTANSPATSDQISTEDIEQRYNYHPVRRFVAPPSGGSSSREPEEDHHNQVPNTRIPSETAELPPPPYHIAIMLPSQNDREIVQLIRDSPPPSYEKAVT